MRKLLLMFGTFVALVAAFFIYFTLQTKFGFSADEKKQADEFPDVSLKSDRMIKPGSGAWSKQFDRDGNLYSQFKCQYYDPQPDGMVKLTYPVIQFFLSNGQVMQIEGKNGNIQFAAGTDKSVLTNSPSEPPRYGSLRDVKVKLFSSADRLTDDNVEMTMTMANAQFDNDTYRLFTQEYTDESGKVWHADDVPVTVNAKDYSFNGWGLVLYWNDVDKRLKSLRIARGKDLTIYHAEDLSANSASPTSAPRQTPASAPGQAASAPQAAPVAETSGSSASRQRYTATFFDSVRVLQGGQDLVEADRMAVDFSSRHDQQSSSNATPAPVAATSPSAAAGAPSAPASTQPAQEPVVIHWKGPMEMVPTDVASAPPLEDGKAIIYLTGSPVRVHQHATSSQRAVDIQCRDLKYRTENSDAHLSGDVILNQMNEEGPPSTVEGEDVEFSQVARMARVNGPGKSSLPDPHDPNSVLVANWDKRCTVNFYDLQSNQAQIQRAELEGDVVIEHPRFRLTARDKVRLGFDVLGENGTDGNGQTPPLREITATGDANCIVHEANNEDRAIGGETLKLLREPDADGNLYAKQIVCDGSVHAEQGDEHLNSQHLTVDLLPSTRKSEATDDLAGEVALDRLVATRDVVVAGKDGSGATADDLEVHMVDDHPHVKLLGSGDQPAMVKNKTSTLKGWDIRLAPHDQTAFINGPGVYDGLQQSQNSNEKPHPLKLAWQQNASLDGNGNRVIVNGSVTAVSDDGVNTQSAAGDRIVATLADVTPTTLPSTRAAKSDSMTDGADFMRNKQVKFISLQTVTAADAATTRPTARVTSEARDAEGHLAHEYDLFSAKIDFDPVSRRLNVDGPGDILAQEQAPTSTTQAATEPSSAIGGNGNTAIDWHKGFSYDEAAHAATIEGDITIIHQAEGANAQAIHLDHADKVRADFYSDDTGKKPAGNDQAATPKLKQVSAVGGMVIRTADKTISCGEWTFDPADNLLTCRGGQLGKVTVVDNSNINGVTCDEAIFDVKTNAIRKLTNVTGQGR